MYGDRGEFIVINEFILKCEGQIYSFTNLIIVMVRRYKIIRQVIEHDIESEPADFLPLFY